MIRGMFFTFSSLDFFLISVSQTFTLLHDLSFHCSQCSYRSECAKLHPMPCLRCGKLSHTVSACSLAAPSQNRGMYSCGICVPDNQFVLYLSCPPSSPYFLLFYFSPSWDLLLALPLALPLPPLPPSSSWVPIFLNPAFFSFDRAGFRLAGGASSGYHHEFRLCGAVYCPLGGIRRRDLTASHSASEYSQDNCPHCTDPEHMRAFHQAAKNFYFWTYAILHLSLPSRPFLRHRNCQVCNHNYYPSRSQYRPEFHGRRQRTLKFYLSFLII